MPKLKTLSGSDLIKILFLFGFEIKSQKGSHVKLVRIIEKNEQVLTIPNHKELDKGTLRAIFRQASRFISESSLFSHFYSE
jgi:predicted RNA binding protein YcfA (HicA-like mRNA interferase family)